MLACQALSTSGQKPMGLVDRIPTNPSIHSPISLIHHSLGECCGALSATFGPMAKDWHALFGEDLLGRYNTNCKEFIASYQCTI